MPISTFNGLAIFGYAVRMNGMFVPRAIQRTPYAGLSGVESIDLGGRGRVTRVEGRLFGATIADLMAAKTVLESFHDGASYTLYDSAGIGWQNVQMEAPEFQGRWTPGAGGFTWAYSVILVHLTQA